MYDNEDGGQENSEEYCNGGYHCVQIGDTFCRNRYKVIRKLGWGAFSTVWLCLDTQFDDFVAIKITKSKKRIQKSVFEEIQMLSAVNTTDPTDPGSYRLVTLLNQFTIRGVNGTHQCLVFEVLGDSLFKFIMGSFRNGIPIGAVKRIIGQTLEGLQFLHTKCKLIHTDIKPENILLTIDKKRIKEMFSEIHNLNDICGQLPDSSNPTVKAVIEDKEESNSLRDEVQSTENIFNLKQLIGNEIPNKKSNIFDGISKTEKLSEISIKIVDLGNACHSGGFHCSTIQTRPYRSPEVILGLGFGPTADIWSTACTAFELATGELLFNPHHIQKSSRNQTHLSQIVGLLGPVPNVYRKSKHFTKYFSNSSALLRKVTKECNLTKLLVTQHKWSPEVAQSFAQFLLPMLEMDPKKRATAQECLSNEWLST